MAMQADNALHDESGISALEHTAENMVPNIQNIGKVRANIPL